MYIEICIVLIDDLTIMQIFKVVKTFMGVLKVWIEHTGVNKADFLNREWYSVALLLWWQTGVLRMIEDF